MIYLTDTDDGDVLFTFDSEEDFLAFKIRQNKLLKLKKEIDRVERNKLSEYLRVTEFESEQHREYCIVAFKAKTPKWKQNILESYIYE